MSINPDEPAPLAPSISPCTVTAPSFERFSLPAGEAELRIAADSQRGRGAVANKNSPCGARLLADRNVETGAPGPANKVERADAAIANDEFARVAQR
jgi:hypothetical protein